MNNTRFPLARRLALATVAVAAVIALAAGLKAAPSIAAGSSVSRAATGGTIVATYGVGGVLKTDGRLYQWRPEKKQWVTIDESFRLDGETRSILPLPVSATEVTRMEGFGFLVTRSGTCWLYNLDTNRWENIGRP
ncbi:MAG: hypothetical protein ABI960_05520 [Candidatus Eisenbacteria bacterium]